MTPDLIGRLDKALKASADMYSIAKSAGVDIEKPQDAIAPLKQQGSKITDQDRKNLQISQEALNAQRDAFTGILLQAKSKRTELIDLLESLRQQPGQSTFNLDDYKAAKDDIEHVYDGSIQVAKFVIEIADGPASAVLELLGTDLLKDATKGGNIDELMGPLKDGVEDLQARINHSLAVFKRFNSRQIDHAADALADIRSALDKAYRDYVRTAGNFDKLLKEILSKVSAGKGQGSNPDADRVGRVYQAISEANKNYQDAKQALSKTSELLPGLKDWMPLTGKLVFDGRDPGTVSMVVYQKTDLTCFYMPAQGLTHSLDDLASAVGKVQQLETIDGDKIERLRDEWTSAMVDGI